MVGVEIPRVDPELDELAGLARRAEADGLALAQVLLKCLDTTLVQVLDERGRQADALERGQLSRGRWTAPPRASTELLEVDPDGREGIPTPQLVHHIGLRGLLLLASELERLLEGDGAALRAGLRRDRAGACCDLLLTTCEEVGRVDQGVATVLGREVEDQEVVLVGGEARPRPTIWA